MLKYIKTVIFSSSLLFLGPALNAQVNPDRDPYYDHDRDLNRAPNNNVIDQVRADLNRARNTGYMKGWQRSTLARADHDLARLEMINERGRVDRHEIDQAIARIQTVANSDRLSPEQRSMLQQDIARLQDFSMNQPTYSYRENPSNQNNGYYDRYGNWHPNR